MHRRRALWLVAAAVVLPSLPLAATWSMQFADRASRRDVECEPEVASAAETTFRHGSHLPPDWHAGDRKTQHERHCKQCHEFGDGVPFGFAPVAQSCSPCHYNGVSAAHDPLRLELRGGEPPPSSRESTYDHSSKGHRERACLDCHPWKPGPRGQFDHPDVMFDMPASLEVCADCHHHGADDPAAKWQQKVAQDGSGAAWRATWNAATTCTECHKAGTPRMLDRHQRSNERLFEHASHVPQADLGKASQSQSCKECHAMDGKDAASSMGVTQVSCARCHFADQGAVTTKLAADREVERMPTLFSHATKGHVQKCSVCHPMANDATDPTVGRLYSDCTATCHDERKVERHGAWACTDCHANDNAKTDADARAIATTQVERRSTATTFAFAKLLHPGVTNNGAIVHPVADGRACTECHRNGTDGLVRAAVARPFTHDGHLTAVTADTPTAACVTCHVSVAETAKPAQVHAFDASAAKERASCTSVCHQSPQMSVAVTPAPVTVPLFSHAQHAKQACATCHVAANGITNLRSATLTDTGGGAFACSQCHGHKDPEKKKNTGGYDTTKESNVCFQCHVEKKEGQSFASEKRREQRFQLVADQRQFHSKAGDCRRCHAFDDAQKPPRTTPIRITAHRDLHHKHPLADGRTLADVRPEQLPADCRSCHRMRDPRAR